MNQETIPIDNPNPNQGVENCKSQVEDIKEADNDLIDDILDKPGTIARAKIHGQAQHILNIPDPFPDNQNVDFCEDCNLPVEFPGIVEKFNYCVDPKKLAIAGYGVYLYFFFVNYVIINLLGIIIIASLPYIYMTQVYSDELGVYCTEYFNNVTIPIGVETNSTECIYFINIGKINPLSLDWINNWSSETMSRYGKLVNSIKGDSVKTDLVNNFNVVSFITLIVLLFVNMIFASLSTAIVNEIDFNEESPSDYTLMISDIPHEHNIHGKVKEFLLDEESLIHELNLTYHLTEFKASKGELIEMKKTRRANKGKETYTTGYFCWKKECSVRELKKSINEKTKETNALENEMDETFNGVAFIVFANQSDQEKYYKKFPHSFFHKLFSNLFSRFQLHLCCCLLSEERKRRLKRKSTITVEKAPEPQDVIWENLEYKFINRLGRNFVGNLVSLICIAISFGLVFLLNWAQSNEEKKTNNSVLIYAFSIAISLVVQIINITMSIVFRFFSTYEKPWSYTVYYLSLSIKQTFFTFFNSAIIPLVSNIVQYGWDNHDMLVNNMFMMFVLDALLSPLLSILCIDLYTAKLKRWYFERDHKDENKPIKEMTQRELNEIYEGPDMEISGKYSDLVESVLLTCFYMPIFPFGAIISFVGAIASYYVEKFKFLHIYKKPQMFNHTLCFFYIDYFVVALFVYGIGNWIFLANTFRTNFYEYINIILYGSLAIIPYRTLFRICDLSGAFSNTNEITFEDAYFSFSFDYERLNPKTQKMGVINYLRRLKDRMIISDDIFKQTLDHLSKINVMELFHATRNGTRQRTRSRRSTRKPTILNTNKGDLLNLQHLQSHQITQGNILSKFKERNVFGARFNSILNIHAQTQIRDIGIAKGQEKPKNYLQHNNQITNIQNFFSNLNLVTEEENNEDNNIDNGINNFGHGNPLESEAIEIINARNNAHIPIASKVIKEEEEKKLRPGMILSLNADLNI